MRPTVDAIARPERTLHILTTLASPCQARQHADATVSAASGRLASSSPCPLRRALFTMPVLNSTSDPSEIPAHPEGSWHELAESSCPLNSLTAFAVLAFLGLALAALHPGILSRTRMVSRARPASIPPGFTWSHSARTLCPVSRGASAGSTPDRSTLAAAQGQDRPARFLDVLLHQLPPRPARPWPSSRRSTRTSW